MDTSKWIGQTVRIENHPVGVVTGVYVSDITGEIEWLEVEILGNLFTKKVVVPCLNNKTTKRYVELIFPLKLVTNAPKAPKNGHLTREEEKRLKSYYAQQEIPAKVVMFSFDGDDLVEHRRVETQETKHKHQSFHLVKGKSFRLISEKELV